MEPTPLRRAPLILLLIPALTAGGQELKGAVVPLSLCNPPCPPDQWCGQNLGRRIKLLTNGGTPWSDYICLKKTIKCYNNGDCPSGSTCRRTNKGNCCYPRTCSKKCGSGQRCQSLPRRCPAPPPNAPPCYCPPIYRCVDARPPPRPRCDPPCRDGTRCGVASGFGAELMPKKYTCVRDSCSSKKPCPRGSVCQSDPRGNCCRFVTCAKTCADNEVCTRLPPTVCYNPGPNPPPCFCQQGYACKSRCQPPCGKNERCTLPSTPLGGLEPAPRRYTCLPKPTDECLTDGQCPAGSSCRKDSRGNCCYPTSCPNRCPIGERCQALFPPCPNPGPNPPPCYCKPYYRCTSCKGPRCPIG